MLAELLLRGPQTEGELRGRASRMEPIEDLDKLRAVLKPLAERRLIVYLTPEGRRGTTLTHGFYSPQELERLRAKYAGAAMETPTEESIPTASPAAAAPPLEWQKVHEEIAALKATVSELQSRVEELARQVQELKAGLGV